MRSLPPHTMKFLHAADIHLDSPIKNLSLSEPEAISRIRRATREAFARLVDLALSERVSLLLLAGDLYDHDAPNMQIALFLRGQLRRLADAGIPVVIVRGNHDAENRITPLLDLPENTRVLSSRHPETVVFDEIGVSVTGQSFVEGPVTDNLARGYPPPRSGTFNIALLHTSLGGSPDHDSYAPCSLSDLASRGYDYWALGHIHKGEILSRDPYVVYPGNLQGRHARETGPKGAVLVETEGGRVLSCRMVPLDGIRWHQLPVSLDGAASLSEAGDRLRAALREAVSLSEDRPAVVRVLLSGRTPLASGPLSSAGARRQIVLEASGEIGGGELWVEKVVGSLVPEEGARREAGGGSTGDEFFSVLSEVLEDRKALEEILAPEIEALRARLPDPLQERLSPSAPDSLFPDLAEILPDLREMLSRKELS